MRRSDEMAVLALAGNQFAVEYLVAYYEGYINSLSCVTIRDVEDRLKTYLDPTIKIDLRATILELLQTFSMEKAIAAMQEVESDDA